MTSIETDNSPKMKNYKQQYKLYTNGKERFILLHIEIMFQKLEILTSEILDFLNQRQKIR